MIVDMRGWFAHHAALVAVAVGCGLYELGVLLMKEVVR